MKNAKPGSKRTGQLEYSWHNAKKKNNGCDETKENRKIKQLEIYNENNNSPLNVATLK